MTDGVSSFLYYVHVGLEWLFSALGHFLSYLLGYQSPDPGAPQNNWILLLPLVGLGAAFTVVKFGIYIVRSFAFGF